MNNRYSQPRLLNHFFAAPPPPPLPHHLHPHEHPLPPRPHFFPQHPITIIYPINTNQAEFMPVNPTMIQPIIQQEASPQPPSGGSTPPSKREIQRQQSIRGLLLKPMENPTDVVVIVLPNTSQKFTIHHALLSHFSPYFKNLLAIHLSPPPPPFTAPIQIKMFNYNNELDLQPVPSVPMDLNSHQPFPQNLEEWENIEVQVVVRLPGSNITLPRTTQLPKELGIFKGKVMGAFVNWLYLEEFGKVVDFDDALRGKDGLGKKGTGELEKVDACSLIELWVLAGRLGAKTCQNDCIVAIEKLRKANNTIETGMLKWIYMNTIEYEIAGLQCPLRNLLIDQCAWLLDEKWMMSRGNGLENDQVFPRDALIDCFARMRALLRDGRGIDHSIGHDLDHIEERKGDRYWVKEDIAVDDHDLASGPSLSRA